MLGCPDSFDAIEEERRFYMGLHGICGRARRHVRVYADVGTLAYARAPARARGFIFRSRRSGSISVMVIYQVKTIGKRADCTIRKA